MKWNSASLPTTQYRSVQLILSLFFTLYQATETTSVTNSLPKNNPDLRNNAIHLTALDTYMRRPDDVYRWHDTGHRMKGILPGGSWEGSVLNFTSQQWLTPDIVTCSVWTHTLVVIIPHRLEFNHTGFLLIGGGNNDGSLPSSVDQLLLIAAAVAVETRSQAAVLYQVPNQPCVFEDDPLHMDRTEDEIIAYTWRHFVDQWNDTDWPLRLPMTKAAARALDTWQAFSTLQIGAPVEGFVVGGASKRGWTAWTLAAVDGRVVGLVPMVMDALQFGASMHHYYRSLGGWPFAFQPYYDLGLTTEMDSEGMRRMMDVIDPYSYLDRLRMPKLIIVASNDEFFMMDDSKYYWKELRGEKHLLILANVEHSLLSGIPKIIVAVQAFYLNILQKRQDSSYQLAQKGEMGGDGVRDRTGDGVGDVVGDVVEDGAWDGVGSGVRDGSEVSQPCFKSRLVLRGQRRGRLGEGGGKGVGRVGFEEEEEVLTWTSDASQGLLYVQVAKKPSRIILCSTKTLASGSLCLQPILFLPRPVQKLWVNGGRYEYIAKVEPPTEGYVAFFVEVHVSGPRLYLPFISTTEVVISPNTFPFPDCSGVECKGTLV